MEPRVAVVDALNGANAETLRATTVYCESELEGDAEPVEVEIE